MQLFVRSESGQMRVLAVDSHATVATVASLCEEPAKATQPPPTPRAAWLPALHFTSTVTDPETYLSYGGVPLRPSATLADHGIQNQATLTRCVRQRGGCFAFSITLWIIIFVCFLLSICTCGLSLPVALVLIPIALVLPLCCL